MPPKGEIMLKKMFVVGLLIIFAATLSFADNPKIEHHGLFYIYSFSWKNADFNKDTDDGDQHYYLHGDFSVDADFGAGVSSKVTFGAWGTYGKHAITGGGPESGVALREVYLNIDKLFDTPLSFSIGKQHICYGDQVFDGGEDGFMGAKLSYGSDKFGLDLFSYRLEEGGGTDWIGTNIGTEVPDDWNLHGLWATAKLMDSKVTVSPYGFYRVKGDDKPMWLGLRSDGSPINGLNYAAEFTTMMGEDAAKVDYKGMHYMGRLGYTLPAMPLTVGAAYVSLSGDDPDTGEKELYESPTWGPYTFGFYKDWPGFGPAHLLRTAYGFSLLAPWSDMVANLNVINGNVGYNFGKVNVRVDLFNYEKNQATASSKMGNEIALMLKYNYNDTITFGATGGYWTPGKYFGDDLDPMLGGYLWTAIGF